MLDNLLGKDVSAFVVPVAALSGRSEGVFIETRPIFSRAARIAFGEVGADRTQRPIELISHPERASILHQLRHIMPAHIRNKHPKNARPSSSTTNPP